MANSQVAIEKEDLIVTVNVYEDAGDYWHPAEFDTEVEKVEIKAADGFFVDITDSAMSLFEDKILDIVDNYDY